MPVSDVGPPVEGLLVEGQVVMGQNTAGRKKKVGMRIKTRIEDRYGYASSCGFAGRVQAYQRGRHPISHIGPTRRFVDEWRNDATVGPIHSYRYPISPNFNHVFMETFCYSSRMKERGAALPSVLALVAAILVIGLAMGSLSTLSLQFNRRQLEGIRSEMAARSALATLVAKLYKADTEGTLNPLKPEATSVADLFPAGLEVREGDYTVSIHFGGEVGFSSDNLVGDAPRTGWPDSDDVPRVPPYSLDVILNVAGPSSSERYRAGLKRVWPYALYTTLGPITLMGQPKHQPTLSFPSPTTVKGDVYTSWHGNEANGGTQVTGYGLGLLKNPSDLLANLEARAGYQPQRKPDYPLIIGMPVGYNAPQTPTNIHASSTDTEKFYFYDNGRVPHDLGESEDDPTFSPGPPQFHDIGNTLDGDFLYEHDLDLELEPFLVPAVWRNGQGVPDELPGRDNFMLGSTHIRRGLALDPLAEITEGQGAPASTFESADFTPLNLPHPAPELLTAYQLNPLDVAFDENEAGDPPFLLDKDLVLTPNENSTTLTPGDGGTHFVIHGSVSNRQVVYNKVPGPSGSPPGLYVHEVLAGMKLQDVVLHVEGDLDLGATAFEPAGAGDEDGKGIEISGAGATLIVDGKLILGNATINAEDQGFVVYARDIVLKGGGNFFGLMIAENSISILSQDGNPLTIHGALLCGGTGGIIVRGAELKHDSRYLKSINGAGDFVMTSWKKLP